MTTQTTMDNAKQEAGSSVDKHEIVAKFRELQNDCANLINKITELEIDRNEHK